MKAKVYGVLITVSMITLAAMLALSFLSEGAGCKNLLLITTRGAGLQGQKLEKVEELCEDDFLLTYEIPKNAAVRAANSRYSVTLIGTNSAYLDVMGYTLLNGGFFTKSAWDSRSRHAVLNETAAYNIFGGRNISGGAMQIDGDTWLVTGVIRDNDTENSNIYAPSSVTGGQTQSLMAMMSPQNGIGEAYVINGLKDLGLRESDSDFINLSQAASAFEERFWVSLKAAWCVAVILLAKKGTWRIVERLSAYKKRLRKVYLRELIAERRAELAKIAAVAAALLAGLGTVLYFALQILETCLKWHDLSLPARYLTGDFAGRLTWIYDYRIIGVGAFSVFLLTLPFYVVLAWKKSRKTVSYQALAKMPRYR